MLFRNVTRLLGALLLAAPLASAQDHDQARTRVIVDGDDGDRATVTLDGGRLRIIADENGETSVHEFDFSGLGELIDGAVSAAMADLDDALDEDLTIELDEDMLFVEHGDQACAVNLNVIAEELRNTLADVHVQIGRELRHAGRVHHRHEQDDTAELKAELDRLKADLQKLRGDLDRVR